MLDFTGCAETELCLYVNTSVQFWPMDSDFALKRLGLNRTSFLAYVGIHLTSIPELECTQDDPFFL